MSIFTKWIHDIVYWGNPQPDGKGHFTFDDPIQIRGRWSEHGELFATAAGKQEMSKGSALVDRDLDMDGYLYHGTLDDLDTLDSTRSPYNNTDLIWQIRAFRKVFSVSGGDVVRKVWM